LDSIRFLRENIFSRPAATSEKRAKQLQKKFRHMVVLGIGGSSMGGKAIDEILGFKAKKYSVEYIDNIDGHFFHEKLKQIKNPKQTHFVLVSKSGNTVETLAMGNFVNQWLKEKKLNLIKQCTVISELKENILTNWAKKNKVPVLEIPLDVGGRFSVLTPVGLLPAAFMGLDIEEIRQGALWGVQHQDVTVQLIAQSIASFRRNEWITCLWSYCDNLRNFGLWYQQLWAESLAKKVDREQKPAPRASTPIPLTGSCDQHSVLQQIAEGPRDKFIWFLRVSESEDYGKELKKDIFESKLGFENKNLGRVFAAQAAATAQGLEQMGVQSLSLRVGQIREKELGALFMLFQVVVASLGEHLNINAFDQPGVELGKRLAKQILQN
jgi:glucose-6-phosphate isomerase